MICHRWGSFPPSRSSSYSSLDSPFRHHPPHCLGFDLFCGRSTTTIGCTSPSSSSLFPCRQVRHQFRPTILRLSPLIDSSSSSRCPKRRSHSGCGFSTTSISARQTTPASPCRPSRSSSSGPGYVMMISDDVKEGERLLLQDKDE